MDSIEHFLDTVDLTSDYDDFLYRLMEKACAVGMLPSQFWEEEPADTLVFIDARIKRKQQELYDQALLFGRMNAVNLANLFLEKGKPLVQYPTFCESFDVDDPNAEKIDRMAARRVQLLAALHNRGKTAWQSQ